VVHDADTEPSQIIDFGANFGIAYASERAPFFGRRMCN
jgi:hypothetical protein